MSFKDVIEKQPYPLLVEKVDTKYYKAAKRRIHHVFHRAKRELEILIINLAHNKQCAMLSHCHCLSRPEMRRAIQTLVDNGYIELVKNHYHNLYGKGRARVYQRTPLFEETFKFRLPKRIIAIDSALMKPKPIVNKPIDNKTIVSLPSSTVKPASLYRAVSDTNVWHSSEKYQQLIENVELSLSDGGQVFKDVWLFRDKARLFQHGANNYQQLSGVERKLLLINNEPTIELDYKSLHPNLLLNRTGNPCPSVDIYGRIVKELGLRRSKSRRGALKLIMLVALNINSTRGFSMKVSSMTYKKGDKKGQRAIDDLGVRPIDVYRAIITAYPALKPYVCTGKQALSLQQEDSKIMIDVLETLAKRGVVALPVHDSVIVPVEHRDLAKQTMLDCYKKHTGFEIGVK